MVADAKKSSSKKASDEPARKKSTAKSVLAAKTAKKSDEKSAVITKKAASKSPGKTAPAKKASKSKPKVDAKKPAKKTTAAAEKRRVTKDDVTAATLREMTPQAEARDSLVQVESQKYGPESVQRPETYHVGHLPTAREIDRTYGDTKIVLLVRDPEWIFAYWEISLEAREHFAIPKDRHDKTLMLRWYDVTGLREFTGSNANTIMDIQVNDFSISWYQKMPVTSRSWCAELGIVDEKGRFIPICRSQVVHTPRNAVAAPGKEEEWAHVDELRLRQIYEASGVTQLPTTLSSGGMPSSAGLVSSERLVR